MFRQYSEQYIGASGNSAHNGYLRVLAEAGLIGFIPMMVVTIAVARRSLWRVGEISTELEFWRPYFVAALVAQFVTNVFNDYFWERYLWVTFAFFVALESTVLRARAEQARERLLAGREAMDARSPIPAPRAPALTQP